MSEAARIRSSVERGDPDAILARMRADREHDWPTRILTRMAEVPDTLSKREIEVLRCASYGLTEPQTGHVLHLAAGTICNYRDSARYRLRAKNTTHAVALALRAGLIA